MEPAQQELLTGNKPDDYEALFFNCPSHKSRVETYLWDNCSANAIESIARLYDKAEPIAETVVFIPVLATSESHHIVKALSCYAAQENCDPFTVLINLNQPAPADSAAFDTCMQAFAEAQKLYGDKLDIRIMQQVYDNPTIGAIRKDLWDTGVGLAHAAGHFDEPGGEVIGINHDIDTVSMSTNYVSRIQSHYRRAQHDLALFGEPDDILGLTSTGVSHTYPFDSHPMTARGIFWADISHRQLRGFGGYEEGLVIPLTRYAYAGGFYEGDKTHETRPFMYGARSMKFIPGTHMKTSPRRYIDRFPAYGFDRMWTDDSFGATDPCRDIHAPKVDATFDQLEQHVFNSLGHFLQDLYYAGPTKTILDKTAAEGGIRVVTLDRYGHEITESEKVEHALRLLRAKYSVAMGALRNVVGSEMLACLVRDDYNPQKYAKSILARSVHIARP